VEYGSISKKSVLRIVLMVGADAYAHIWALVIHLPVSVEITLHAIDKHGEAFDTSNRNDAQS
jgi:hypothetical protein